MTCRYLNAKYWPKRHQLFTSRGYSGDFKNYLRLCCLFYFWEWIHCDRKDCQYLTRRDLKWLGAFGKRSSYLSVCLSFAELEHPGASNSGQDQVMMIFCALACWNAPCCLCGTLRNYKAEWFFCWRNRAGELTSRSRCHEHRDLGWVFWDFSPSVTRLHRCEAFARGHDPIQTRTCVHRGQ